MSKKIGTISVLDLDVLCQEYGRGFLPYPFRLTRPTPYHSVDDLDGYRRRLLERFASGEFDHLRRWLDVQIRDAEIRVASMFMNTEKITAAFSATRWRELGFIADQDAEDVISVRRLSAYDLGPEIGALAELSGRPGAHPRVTVPSLNVHIRSPKPTARNSTVVDEVRVSDAPVVVPFDDLVAGGEIHTDYRPPTGWDPDRSKDFLGWFTTTNGDYVVTAPYEFATPVTRTQLIAKIDRLIADDAAQIRELRAADEAFSEQW